MSKELNARINGEVEEEIRRLREIEWSELQYESISNVPLQISQRIEALHFVQVTYLKTTKFP